ncbi:unnamed protein product, partial [Prorocentrum cordatum]
MASLATGGIKLMGEIVGGDASATDQIKNGWLHMVAVQAYEKPDKPERFVPDPTSAFSHRDTPLHYADSVVSLKHLVDWVTLEDGAADQLDTVDVHDAMCGSNYMALPAPFKLNKDLGEIDVTMQLYILPKDANGEQYALRYVRFDNKVRADIAKEVFVAGYDKGKREAGYRFIEEFGPRANSRDQFAEWTDEQINDERSPIFGWQAAEVKESLRNCASGSDGAKTLERWAVALKHSHLFVFDNVVIPILESHNVHGTM